jgi:hypothetical protein
MSEEFKKLIPGFLQGITRVTISYPFDVVKVNMQKMLFNDTKSTIKFLLKEDPKRFYRGSFLSYINVGLDRSLQFYVMEKLNSKESKDSVIGTNGSKTFKNPYINGFLVSMFSSIYNIPVQYLTTNIALSHKLNSVKKYINELYKNKINFYKGFILESFKNQLGSTIFMGTYYVLRNKLGENTFISPIYGGISGVCVWLVIFPFDTVRTLYQTETRSIKTIFLNRKVLGYTSFYKGITPVLFRTIPSASLGMLVYETSRKKLLN